MNNKIIIAAAGSGKTRYLVNQAASIISDPILITTFTLENEKAIRNKIIAKIGYLPSNITIQTWVSFLLEHGVRPYQSVLNDDIHKVNIGFILVNGKSAPKLNRNGEPVEFNGRAVYYGEEDFKKFYFTNDFKIYSDKISKFVCSSDEHSDGEVISRITRIYKHIFIDEIQDLAGYDLEIVNKLFESESSVLLVGDPRQVTYSTHYSRKYVKYANGQIKLFIENELKKKVICEVDETTLSASHRNNQVICDYSSRLYPNLPAVISCCCKDCQVIDEHLGVFIIKPSEVDQYLETYKPTQLRWSSSVNVNSAYPVMNFGQSKGATLNRVLIYPTEEMINWIKDNDFAMKNEARSKLYVGLTRAIKSSTIIMEYEDGTKFKGAKPFKFDCIN